MTVEHEAMLSKHDHDASAPNWYNRQGWGMELDRSNTAQTQMGLKSLYGSDKLCVRYDPRAETDTPWSLAWMLFGSGSERVNGLVRFTAEDLRAAFGIADSITGPWADGSRWLLERYAATVAHQGRFIRLGRFLNLPCPGTGQHGDPNVSVFLNNGIVTAVRYIIHATER